MTDVPPILRHLLAEAFPNQPRLVSIFEELARALVEAKDTAEAAASSSIVGTSVLTLSASDFPNARLLTAGEGSETSDADGLLTVKVSREVPLVDGDFAVRFIVTGETNRIRPSVGQLATLADLGAVSASGVTSFN